MIPLATLPLDVIHVACTRCDRRGQYPIARLVERHGSGFTVIQLLDMLTAGCPMREPGLSIYERCGAHCPGLAKALGVGASDGGQAKSGGHPKAAAAR